MFRLLSIVALLACLAACGGEVSFPPPPQRVPVAHPISRSVAAVLGMGPDEGDMPWGSIVQDVLAPAPAADWRWTRAHPAFKFELLDYEGWKATVRVTAVEKVLAATGPQHVAVTVNGALVGTATLARTGRYDLAFPVDAALLKRSSPIVLGLDTDPCLIADSPPEKGLKYCLLVHSAGFVRDGR